MSVVLKRFVNENFYMEAILENGQLKACVGCVVKVEMVELNMVRIQFEKSEQYYTIGEGIEWLADEGAVIPTIEELILDYQMYTQNMYEFDKKITTPDLYVDEYENNVNRLPEPLKRFLLKILEGDM